MLKSLPLARGEHLLDTRISGLRVLLRTHNNSSRSGSARRIIQVSDLSVSR